MTVFVRIPLYSFTIGFLWLRLLWYLPPCYARCGTDLGPAAIVLCRLWWRPKLLIWMTMLGNGSGPPSVQTEMSDRNTALCSVRVWGYAVCDTEIGYGAILRQGTVQAAAVLR
eukprot:3940280-Rhodomonas_salina.2